MSSSNEYHANVAFDSWIVWLNLGPVNGRLPEHLRGAANGGPSRDVRRRTFMRQWPAAVVRSGRARLVDLGALSVERSRAVLAAFTAAEQGPGTRVVTPAVLEIVARRPSSVVAVAERRVPIKPSPSPGPRVTGQCRGQR
jgi:hypothetical protein